MKGFVTRGKMSKKQRKELDKKGRREWVVAPVTRVIPNKKKEAEKKPRPGSYDAGWGFPYIGYSAEKRAHVTICRKNSEYSVDSGDKCTV